MEYLGLSIKKILSYRLKTRYNNIGYFFKHYLTNKTEFDKTKSLRDSKKNRKAFVFGNGPSLKKLDPLKVKNYLEKGFDLITVNSFMYSDWGQILTPTYHLFSDPLEFIEVPDDHPRAERAKKGKVDKEKVIEKKIPIFVPIEFKKYNDYDKTYYFNDAENIFSENAGDITKPRGYKSYSGMKALAVACFLGYEQIFISGMDYSMFKSIKVDKDNKLFREVEHHYDDDNRPSYKFYYKKKYSTSELLYLAHFDFKVHDKFKNYHIINLSSDGLIDSFPKYHNLDIY